MRQRIWVTYHPVGDCMCWRDAACSHDWTWREDPTCNHEDDIIGDVHESLADAVRSLFSICGAEAVGRLLRHRDLNGRTMTVYIMPPGADLTDDHDADHGDGPTPYRIIERKFVASRSRPGDQTREFADSYRRKVGVA